MKRTITLLSIIASLLLSLAGCQKYDDPGPFATAEMTRTMSIMEFKAMYPGRPIEFSTLDNIVLAG